MVAGRSTINVELFVHLLSFLRYGRIEYKSKAEVLIPTCNPVESLEEEFIIHSRDTPDVEAKQEAMEAVLPKENVEYGTLGGGCFVKKSHVELFIKVDKSVYKQGQYIRPVVECTVEQGRYSGITVLWTTLKKLLTFLKQYILSHYICEINF